MVAPSPDGTPRAGRVDVGFGEAGLQSHQVHTCVLPQHPRDLRAKCSSQGFRNEEGKPEVGKTAGRPDAFCGFMSRPPQTQLP